jgi:hypothetical protein
MPYNGIRIGGRFNAAYAVLALVALRWFNQ